MGQSLPLLSAGLQWRSTVRSELWPKQLPRRSDSTDYLRRVNLHEVLISSRSKSVDPLNQHKEVISGLDKHQLGFLKDYLNLSVLFHNLIFFMQPRDLDYQLL